MLSIISCTASIHQLLLYVSILVYSFSHWARHYSKNLPINVSITFVHCIVSSCFICSFGSLEKFGSPCDFQGTCHPSHWPKLWLKPAKLMDFDQLQRIHLQKASGTLCADENRPLKAYPLRCFCCFNYSDNNIQERRWNVLDSPWLYKIGYITSLKSGNLSVAIPGSIVGSSDLPHPFPWHLTRTRDQCLPRELEEWLNTTEEGRCFARILSGWNFFCSAKRTPRRFLFFFPARAFLQRSKRFSSNQMFHFNTTEKVTTNRNLILKLNLLRKCESYNNYIACTSLLSGTWRGWPYWYMHIYASRDTYLVFFTFITYLTF